MMSKFWVGQYTLHTSVSLQTTPIIDPLTINLPLLKQPIQFYPDPKKAPQIVQDLNDKVKKADAYVLVTAEYNRSMPPALTNLIDHFPPRSFGFKSSAIVAYSLGNCNL